MQPLFSLITVLCVVGAFVALGLAVRKPEHRATLSFTALGAVLAIPVTMSLSPNAGMMTRTGSSTPPDAGPEAVSRDGAGERFVEPERDYGSPRSEFTEPQRLSHARTERRSSREESANQSHPTPEPSRDEAGAVELSVGGSWEPSTSGEFHSAVLSALQDVGWSGLSHGGRKRLRITGSIRDLDLVLGQLSAASVSARWELRSNSGAVLAQGAASDVRGKGTDQSDARLAAVGRAASEVASQIVRQAP
jgi:hypothetical protein